VLYFILFTSCESASAALGRESSEGERRKERRERDGECFAIILPRHRSSGNKKKKKKSLDSVILPPLQHLLIIFPVRTERPVRGTNNEEKKKEK